MNVEIETQKLNIGTSGSNSASFANRNVQFNTCCLGESLIESINDEKWI
jgi:hypothetical protein